MTVAALYIDPRGPYPKLEGVDCYDEARDARTYPGPWPIVAHPPCAHWGRLRHMAKQQTKHLAPIAVQQVRRFGGVLEHPAHSLLWNHCGLPLPGESTDEYGGYTVALNQVDWGHTCRKATWLYLVRVPRELLIDVLVRKPTHWVSGNTGEARRHGCKIASAQQRRRTPEVFAEYLVYLASNARLA